MEGGRTFTLKSRGDGDLKTRYRPQRLEEMAPTFSVPRLQSIAENPKARVYLFEGPSGSGKTSCARIVARASVCESRTDQPCLKCQPCKAMEASADFMELNIADLRKIDDIRDIIAGMRFKPMQLSRKIYILDEVHQLTPDAQQVLLKTFEEPQPGLLIIMCTTQTKGLDKALIHRAERVTFKELDKASADQIIDQMLKTTGRETGINRTIRSQLYECADGSVRALLNNIQAFLDGGFDPVSAADDEAGPDVLDLAKALLSANWPAAAEVLKRSTVKTKAETVRIGVENYIRGVVLNSVAIDLKAVHVLNCLVGTVSVEPGISQYNRFVFKCVKACQSK